MALSMLFPGGGGGQGMGVLKGGATANSSGCTYWRSKVKQLRTTLAMNDRLVS